MSIHTEHSAPSSNPANEPNITPEADLAEGEVRQSIGRRVMNLLFGTRTKKAVAAGVATAAVVTGAFEVGASGNSSPAPRAAASHSAPSHPTKPAPKTSAANTSAAPTNSPSSIPSSVAPSTSEAPIPGSEFGPTTPTAIPYVEGQPATYQDVQTLMHDVDISITNLDAEDLWYAGVNPATPFGQGLAQSEFTYFQQQKQSDQTVQFYQHNFSEKDVQFDTNKPNVVHILDAAGTNADFKLPGRVQYYEYTLTLGPTQATFAGGGTTEVLGIQNVNVTPSTNDAWYNGWPAN